MAIGLLVELLGQKLVHCLDLGETILNTKLQADEKDVDASDDRDHAQEMHDDELQAPTLLVRFRVEYELQR